MADQTIAVQQLYVAYFSRPADPAGLAYWANVLNTNADGLQAISANFAASLEYKTAYSQSTSEQIVGTVYQHLFGRVAEAAGVTYWANLMNSGAITIDNVVTQIASGAQDTDKFAYDAKVAVSKAFTEHLDLQTEIAAYSGAHANSLAINYIAGVKDLTTAANAIDPAAIDAVIAQIVSDGSAPAATAPVELVGSAPHVDFAGMAA